MKLNKLAFLPAVAFLLTATLSLSARPAFLHEKLRVFHFDASNPTDLSRTDEIIRIELNTILSKHPTFNPYGFAVTCNGREIPSQFDDGRLENAPAAVLVLSSFGPMEKKSFTVSWRADSSMEHQCGKLTQAVIGIKVDYRKVDGYYTGGRFVDVDSVTVPPDHFAHDALYRIEGPGWESDKIVYRYYLDSRNRNDIFGKKVDRLVLQELGVNDLVSNSMESYTKMLGWGMDIFKVGESLGIGSIAMWHDSKAVTVSDVDKVKCYVSENGPILAGIYTKYLGWKVSAEKFGLDSHLTICAGSRMTRVDLDLKGKPAQLCTGLAKHEDCEFMISNPGTRGGWAYMALYGKQSLAGDDLGIAVFYRESDGVKVTEDSLSRIVVLKPSNGRLTYYFAAAWQQEPGGIKNIREFRKYLSESVAKLNNPIELSF